MYSTWDAQNRSSSSSDSTGSNFRAMHLNLEPIFKENERVWEVRDHFDWYFMTENAHFIAPIDGIIVVVVPVLTSIYVLMRVVHCTSVWFGCFSLLLRMDIYRLNIFKQSKRKAILKVCISFCEKVRKSVLSFFLFAFHFVGIIESGRANLSCDGWMSYVVFVRTWICDCWSVI